MTETVRVARRRITERLEHAGVDSPASDAEWLLRHVTGWGAARLSTSADTPLPGEAEVALEGLVTRREAREPLQLLLGSVGFRYLDLRTAPGVFVPRPETEVLAGLAIERTPRGGVVVEPCTGTGAVAIAVATEAAPDAVHATDVDPAAVALARENAVAHGAPVVVHEGDLLEPVPSALRGRVDVLVSNPPYVAEAEEAALPPEVAGWDPRRALIAGPTGHEASDRLIEAAAHWLAPGGWVLVEVDERRAVEVARRARTRGLVDAGVMHDLAGRDRVVVARRPSPAGEALANADRVASSP